MKCCNYCGKDNEDTLLYCIGCGTELLPPKTVSEFVSTPPVPRVLNAKFATIVFVVFISAQAIGGLAGVLLGFAFNGTNAPSLDSLMPFVYITGVVCGAIALVWVTRAFGFQFNDTSPTGTAWVRGSWRDIGIGFAMGILIYVAYWFISRWIPYTRVPLDPITRMAFRQGLPRICSMIATLLFAPVFEEMSFRGVVYGGYRKSFGPVGAAVITTFLFVVLHEPLYRITRICQLTTLALGAVWLRLRSKAVGPAIAQHFAYNACVTLMNIWFR